MHNKSSVITVINPFNKLKGIRRAKCARLFILLITAKPTLEISYDRRFQRRLV